MVAEVIAVGHDEIVGHPIVERLVADVASVLGGQRTKLCREDPNVKDRGKATAEAAIIKLQAECLDNGGQLSLKEL